MSAPFTSIWSNVSVGTSQALAYFIRSVLCITNKFRKMLNNGAWGSSSKTTAEAKVLYLPVLNGVNGSLSFGAHVIVNVLTELRPNMAVE